MNLHHAQCSRTHSLEYLPLKATVPRCLQMHGGRNFSGQRERADECDRQLSQHRSQCMRPVCAAHTHLAFFKNYCTKSDKKWFCMQKNHFRHCMRPSRAEQAGSSQLHQHVILLRCHPSTKAVQRGRCRTIELAALPRLQIGDCAIVRGDDSRVTTSCSLTECVLVLLAQVVCTCSIPAVHAYS